MASIADDYKTKKEFDVHEFLKKIDEVKKIDNYYLIFLNKDKIKKDNLNESIFVILKEMEYVEGGDGNEDVNKTYELIGFINYDNVSMFNRAMIYIDSKFKKPIDSEKRKNLLSMFKKTQPIDSKKRKNWLSSFIKTKVRNITINYPHPL